MVLRVIINCRQLLIDDPMKLISRFSGWIIGNSRPGNNAMYIAPGRSLEPFSTIEMNYNWESGTESR